MSIPNRLRVVGEKVAAVDGHAKVTGAATFTFDRSLPGMLHIKLLRSPHHHARIRAIDTSAAERMPGVRAVATARDLAGLTPIYGVRIKDQPVLAIEKVRYRGDVVAAVAATDEAAAFAALGRIAVDYEVLPAVMTIDDAMAPGAPLLFDKPSINALRPHGTGGEGIAEPGPNLLYQFNHDVGDIDAAWAQCAHVFEDTFEFSRMTPFQMEPFVALARPEGDAIELWTCSQDPFLIRQDVANIFGLSDHQVRVHASFVGGGYGGKSFCKLEPLVVLMARMTGRPVRLCLTFDENILLLSQHAARLTLKTGVAADGRFVCRDSRLYLDGGAYSDASALVTDKTGYRLPGPYRWTAVRTRAFSVRTTTVPAGSFRGFGGTQANYACESQIDMIARRMGQDPLEVRLKNLLKVGDPYLQADAPMDSDFAAGLRSAATRVGYERSRPPRRGVGLAIGFKDGGGEARAARAAVKITVTGRVVVQGGTAEIGQGASTALCQVAAEMLNVPFEWVKYGEIDTDVTPYDQGTHASSGMTVTGTAVARACEDVRGQILAFAAEKLSCDPGELHLENWTVRHGNTVHKLQPLAIEYFGGYGCEFVGRGFFKVNEDLSTPLNAKRLFWMPAWTGIEVEVDEETGQYEVLNFVCGTDAGRIINAAAARGQVEGGALQGLGQAMFERLIYGPDGLITTSPLTYRLPLAADLPKHFEGFLEEHGMGPGPFGSKGIGESSILGVAAALANAIEDAIGVRITDLPITPEKILTALDAKRRAA
ncbi:MAG TPA: xanthine dehydrogenase family protein molybdopterin-binding subunit [Alphaproteobacteria bacterium]